MKPEDDVAEAVRAVAEALYRAYDAEFNASHLSWQDFAGQARELIQVASPHIERQVRAEVAAEIAEPSVWADPTGRWSADQADAARAMKDDIIRHIARGES